MGYGSTGACTALLQYELDLHLTDLAERIGAPAAQRCYRICLEALTGIERLAAEVGGDSDYRRTSSLYLASARRDVKALERELKARREIGIEVDLLSPSDIRDRFSFERPAALLSRLAGEIDPLRFTHALLAAAARAGARGLRPDRRRTVPVRPQGRPARDRGRVADQGPEGDLRHRLQHPTVRLAPVHLPEEHLRLRHLSPRGVRRVGGGSLPHLGDGPALFLRPDHPGRPRHHRRRRPAVQGVPQAGSDPGQTDDAFGQAVRRDVSGDHVRRGLELGGHLRGDGGRSALHRRRPGVPQRLVALGYGANGVVFGYVASKLLLDLFLGRENPDAELFRIDR